jgi:predicted Zn-dependent protease
VRIRLVIAVITTLLLAPGAAAAPPVAPAGSESQRILAAYGGVYDDPRLQARLAGILVHLGAASGRLDLRFKVTILNSPAIGSFALPDGQLYVTRGLLALASDDADAAGVLSHGMAHVIARHAALLEEERRKIERGGNANDAQGSSQDAANAGARPKITPADLGRALETEADTMAMDLLAKAGYDPVGGPRMLNAIALNTELRSSVSDAPPNVAPLDLMFSHAATPDPQRVTTALIAALQLVPRGGKARDMGDKAAWLHHIDGMTYGHDADGGFVRGRNFIQPRLGFSFMAPEGFVLDVTAQTVEGSNEGAGQTLRFEAVKVPADRSLIEYLNSGWIDDIEDGSVEELLVNGLPAATATAAGDRRSRIYVVRLGSEAYRFIFVTRSSDPVDSAADDAFRKADHSFRESIQTFRRLSEREKEARPLRLKIVKVQPGDTVESLAAAMAFTDHQVERFQALNGLPPVVKPKPGDLVKIVVE